MASGISGVQILRVNNGITVDRAAANLPATTTQTLFNVTGGRVIITAMVGIVTTAIQAQSCTLQLLTLSGAISSNLNLVTGSDVNGLAVNNLIPVPANGATALTFGSFANRPVGFVTGGAATTAIRLTTSATNTGQIRWTLTYIPLDPGAAVAAA
jgi:hypothetical protein